MVNEPDGWQSTFDLLLSNGFTPNSVGKLVLMYTQPEHSAVLYSPASGELHPVHLNERREGYRTDVVAAIRPYLARSVVKRNDAGWDFYDVTDWLGFERALLAAVRDADEDPKEGENWTAREINAAVRAYLEMLLSERRGEPYNKASANLALRRRLPARSKGSIQQMHQNISSVLLGMDLPFIDDYNPLPNIQEALRVAVERYVAENLDLNEALNEATARGEPIAPLHDHVVDAPLILDVRWKKTGPRKRMPRRIDFAALDDRNRSLGRAGEEWALEFERARLSRAGVANAETKLLWVSEKLGDGAGFDIQSVEEDGSPRYIEVKTTNGPATTPFYVSKNELDAAAEYGQAFYLYRVHKFSASARIFILRGDLNEAVTLEPAEWKATFRRFTDS